MTTISSDTRSAMLVEYDQLEQERAGISPKVSTHQRITARMKEIHKTLGIK